MADASLFERFGVRTPEPFGTDSKIYVADARSDLRLIISHHLEKCGFRNVRRGRDGREVLKELADSPADVVIVGDDLPSVCGLDLFRELRERPEMQRRAFLLICQPMSKEEVMLHIEAGISDFLLRPISLVDLKPKIAAAYQGFSNPRNPEQLYELAKAHLREGKLADARAVYQALAASHSGARPLVGLARVTQAEGQLDSAIEICGKAIEKNPHFVHAFSLRAEMLLSKDDVPAALADMKRAVELSPLNVARLEVAANAFLGKEKVSECLDVLLLSAKAGLKHPFVTERIGHCYFLQKEYAKATDFLKEAVRLDPKNVSFKNSLAICYRDAKDFDSAIRTYNEIIKQEPENHQVLFNKALVLVLKEQKDEAIKLLQRVVKIRPEFTKAKEKLMELGGEVPSP